MTFADLIWLALVFGIPLAISLRVFQVEPKGRFFLVTWALAVFGTALVFSFAQILLYLLQLNITGLADGLVAIPASMLFALVVGLVTRAKRAHRLQFESGE